MPKFRAFVKGENFLIYSEDSQQVIPSGFYVNAFIDAQSAEIARDSAIALVRKSHVYAAARNAADDPPRIAVEEVEQISEWPVDTHRPLTGFALYDEKSSSSDAQPKHLTNHFKSLVQPSSFSLISFLAVRTPCGRAAADHCVAQRRPVARANSVLLPFLMNQPIPWRVREISTEGFKRSFYDEFCRTENRCALARR
jgi:hypothetical protein